MQFLQDKQTIEAFVSGMQLAYEAQCMLKGVDAAAKLRSFITVGREVDMWKKTLGVRARQ